MNTHKPPAQLIIWVVTGALITALAYSWFTSREDNAAASATPTAPPEFMMPTLLPPPHPDRLEFFPEYVMKRYAYDPDSYPQYAEVLPEAPCATWENGGLTWSFNEDIPSMKLGWGASVWKPIYRFCGFPLPYPQKPTQTRIENAPREWVIWKSTQIAGTPSPMPTSLP